MGYQMDNFYEIATIVLGCVVVAQYFSKKILRQKMLYMLDRIARRDWAIELTEGGYAVLDEEGDKILSVKGGKRRG
jgi:hypothetical protein